MQDIELITQFLKENPIQILSTSINQSSFSYPNSRPLGSAMLFEGRIYYCMNKNKNMFKELSENPRVCICVCAKDFSWLRIQAKIEFSENLRVKDEFIRLKKTRFEKNNDENFVVFYLKNIKAQLHKGREIQEWDLE